MAGNHPNRRLVDREGLIVELFLPATQPQRSLPAVLILHGSILGRYQLIADFFNTLVDSRRFG